MGQQGEMVDCRIRHAEKHWFEALSCPGIEVQEFEVVKQITLFVLRHLKGSGQSEE